jgi:hypothetical protein
MTATTAVVVGAGALILVGAVASAVDENDTPQGAAAGGGNTGDTTTTGTTDTGATSGTTSTSSTASTGT